MQVSRISVVTYNIYCSDFAYPKRCKAIVDLIVDTDADIVCLQEVLPRFVKEYIAPNDSIRNKYEHISDLTGEDVAPNGVLMLSKFPFAKIASLKMETRMKRKLLLADFAINGETLGVGTVHLESLNAPKMRKKQLAFVASEVSKYKNWIVMGDFNFDSEQNFNNAPGDLENNGLKENFPQAIDCWLHLNQDKPSSGKTVDSETNNMIDHFESMRYDRVMLRSQENEDKKSWKPVSAKLVGTDPISPHVWPSDHFGVFVEFVYQ